MLQIKKVLTLLHVKRVNCAVLMIGFDVRVHVGPVFAYIHAVRTPEPRTFATLVLKMPVQSTVPFIRLLTLRAFEVATRIYIRHHQVPSFSCPALFYVWVIHLSFKQEER